MEGIRVADCGMGHGSAKTPQTPRINIAERSSQPAFVPFHLPPNQSTRPANFVFCRRPVAGAPKRFRAETQNHPAASTTPSAYCRAWARAVAALCRRVARQSERHAGMHHIRHQVDREGGTEGRLCKPIADFTVPHSSVAPISLR